MKAKLGLRILNVNLSKSSYNFLYKFVDQGCKMVQKKVVLKIFHNDLICVNVSCNDLNFV